MHSDVLVIERQSTISMAALTELSLLAQRMDVLNAMSSWPLTGEQSLRDFVKTVILVDPPLNSEDLTRIIYFETEPEKREYVRYRAVRCPLSVEIEKLVFAKAIATLQAAYTNVIPQSLAFCAVVNHISDFDFANFDKQKWTDQKMASHNFQKTLDAAREYRAF
ncbi:hypothetical protein OCU04_008794 [Sclerotinia nivalis]|uniref:Uncharacterized protein n=1 Tax=Sclerotinia nivalis TaxID=352851 RepID=A0A9X0AH38_9HELO|nr:hypothetical protein OCU04_008794 [Sclerotinia nivalis]